MPCPSDQRQTKTTARKPRARSGWSDERRARHAAAIRRWKPWTKSAGPKTAAGKARSSRNAAKPERAADPATVWKKALREQARYLAEINRYIALKKIWAKNELLKRHARNMRRRLVRQGYKVTARLMTAYCYEKVVGEWGGGAVSVSTNAAESPYRYSFREKVKPCSNIMT